MDLYNYKTGDFIRTLTDIEAAEYERLIAEAPAWENGVIDGAFAGLEGVHVYAL